MRGRTLNEQGSRLKPAPPQQSQLAAVDLKMLVEGQETLTGQSRDLDLKGSGGF